MQQPRDSQAGNGSDQTFCDRLRQVLEVQRQVHARWQRIPLINKEEFTVKALGTNFMV